MMPRNLDHRSFRISSSPPLFKDFSRSLSLPPLFSHFPPPCLDIFLNPLHYLLFSCSPPPRPASFQPIRVVWDGNPQFVGCILEFHRRFDAGSRSGLRKRDRGDMCAGALPTGRVAWRACSETSGEHQRRRGGTRPQEDHQQPRRGPSRKEVGGITQGHVDLNRLAE
jgi:hypothetical protein